MVQINHWQTCLFVAYTVVSGYLIKSMLSLPCCRKMRVVIILLFACLALPALADDNAAQLKETVGTHAYRKSNSYTLRTAIRISYDKNVTLSNTINSSSAPLHVLHGVEKQLIYLECSM